jgi:hypothetical protein
MKTTYMGLGDFYFISPSLLVTKNLQNHFLSNYLFIFFHFTFWQCIASTNKTLEKITHMAIRILEELGRGGVGGGGGVCALNGHFR